MTNFPDAPLDVRAELLLNGTWTDVSAYLDHGPVSTGRGHPDESTTVSPSTLGLTLTNNDARFSSKNPTSPYYPYLVRNTPCRVSIPSDQPYLRLEADRSSYASCPAVSVTTDLDARIDVQPTDWGGGNLAGSWGASGSFGWLLTLDPGGVPRLFWSTTGTDFPSARATAALPPGRVVLRATLQRSTGNVTYYTAPGGGADAGPFTQLGAVVNTTGATSLHAPSVPLQAGLVMYGRVYELEVRSAIAGTVVAHPVFSAQSAGATSFADAQSNTWTLSGTAELSARDYRLHAEVPEWPQHQDPTGTSWTVAAKGGGLLRRTSQRNNAINSAMWRAWVKTGVSLAAYHPLEDGAGAQSLASGIGGPAASFSGVLQLGANSDFTCSAPLPVLNGTVIVGRVPAYSGTWQGDQVSWLMEIPSGGEFNGAEIMRVATTGTVAQAVVTYGTGGSMAITGYDSTGATLFASAPVAFAANGQQFLMIISLTPDGSGGVNWALEAAVPGGTSLAGPAGNIASSGTGAVTGWTLNGGGQLLGTVAGHVAVQGAPTIWDVTAFGASLAAHAGEPAGTRFRRLCNEEGIPFRAGGDMSATVLMGVQTQQTLTQLLQECTDADRGVWYELRQALGWGYVPRAALYNQPAAVAVTYATDMLSEWSSDPTEDDKDVRNDETVSQTTGGGSARQFAAPGQAISGGRLAAVSPPSGAGTYDGADSLNVWQVGDLPSLASWIAHVGTVDEPRYPGIVLDLSNRAIASLFYPILALDLGQRLTIAAPPAQLGPDTISQLAWQLTEELWGDTLRITMAGAPSRPYLVAQEGASTGRADTDGSSLAVAATSAATSLQVATASGYPRWTQAAGDFPFDVGIGGERCTVTAIGAGARPNTRTGVYMDQANFQQADYNGVASLWHSLSGQTAPATRYYAGNNLSTYTTNLQEIVAAGARICLSFTPAYNPPSATDRSSITSLLATLKAAGADVVATVHHEPYFTGLTAAQYVAAVQFYGPAMRAYYPFWSVFSGNDTLEPNGYYPGDAYVDGLACDVYLTGGFDFNNNFLVNTQAMADRHGKPLGIWEIGTTTGTNYFTGDNHSFAVGIGNWAAGSNCGAPFHSTVVNPFGVQTGALGFSATAAGSYSVTSAAAASWATQMQACSPGDEITVGAWLQAGTTGRACTAAATFYTSIGAFISTVASGDVSATATDAAGTWTSVMGKVVAPATAAFYAATIQVASAGAGETHRVGMAYGSDSTTQGHTQAGSTTWWQWAQGIMTARLAAGKANGDILLFNSGMPATSNGLATAIQFAADYRIPLWQAIVTALDGTGGPQAFTVTRAVNGVAKSQAAGTPVALWDTPVAAL